MIRPAPLAASLLLSLVAAGAARAGELTVDVRPDTIVLGGTPAQVSVRGAPPGGDVRLVSSLGAVDGGALIVRDRRAPGWAIVAADAGDRRAATRVKLVGTGALPTETKPNAQVTVEIGGRRFGPVVADAEGHAAVPVEVPPEAVRARVIAVDEHGLSTERQVALPAATWPRALVVAPEALGVGQEGTLTVFAIDDKGGWRGGKAPAPTIDLPPGLALVDGPTAAGPGRWDAHVRAVATAEQVEIGASVDGARGTPALMRLQATPVDVARTHTPGGGAGAIGKGARALGMRLGWATGFDTPSAVAGAVDLGWPVWRGALVLYATGELAIVDGTAGTPNENIRDVTYSGVGLAAGLRLRARLRARLALDGELGAGWIFASASFQRRQGMSDNFKDVQNSDGTPILYAGIGLARAMGPGELFFDARWAEAQLDSTLHVAGSAIGLWAALGYRFLF
jgi:hypothetical protein